MIQLFTYKTTNPDGNKPSQVHIHLFKKSGILDTNTNTNKDTSHNMYKYK